MDSRYRSLWCGAPSFKRYGAILLSSRSGDVFLSNQSHRFNAGTMTDIQDPVSIFPENLRQLSKVQTTYF